MPALVLNYFGQGAMLLAHPENVANPFFEMAPHWALYPLVGLATCATVIASQALITAAFSVTKQVIQLGYLPRLRILHTSEKETGQIYIPFVNWVLYGCIVMAVIFFGSSGKLAAAYGITVTIDMMITTVMTFFVIRFAWKMSWLVCVLATELLCHRPDVLQRQRPQGDRRGLVPAADRRGDVQPDDDLEGWP
jgi:KUP system potassium uptake protein